MLLTGIRDFNYAGMLRDGSMVSCQMYLPMPTHGSTTADFFNPLVRHVETTIINRKSPYPVERTLLTSGMVIGGVDSLFAGEKPLENSASQRPVHRPASRHSGWIDRQADWSSACRGRIVASTKECSGVASGAKYCGKRGVPTGASQLNH